MILYKAEFDFKVFCCFSNYLTNRSTQYMWNSYFLPSFRTDIDIGQEFILSSILSALYIVLIFHIFKKVTQNLLPSIPVSILSLVDDRLFISQEKSFMKSNANFFSSYNIISFLFHQFGLAIEHSKSKVFYFSRATKNFDPPPLDLGLLDSSLLRPKDIWRYLEFIFDKKLSFYQHVHYYSNKALSTIKGMKILGNSTRGILPIHKYLLYRMCIISIAFYKFQL